MNLLFAQAILWAAYVLGLCLGLTFCVAVGAALGSVLSHAPLTGGLCGVSYWTFGYVVTAQDSLQRLELKLAALKPAA